MKEVFEWIIEKLEIERTTANISRRESEKHGKIY